MFEALALIRRRDWKLLGAVAYWLFDNLVLYACLAAFGRVGYGTTQALQSRYGPFALYLFVALIGLAAVIQALLHHIAVEPGRRIHRFRRGRDRQRCRWRC